MKTFFLLNNQEKVASIVKDNSNIDFEISLPGILDTNVALK